MTKTSRIQAPRVTTDRSIDCHSLESIAADVCRGRRTKQEKAIALYEFVQRVLFHYPQRSERYHPHDNTDSLRQINTYGYGFCSQQMLVLVDLWRRAGIQSTCWGMPGHCTTQAEYGGAVHWFDPIIGAYVYRRDGRTVASLEEIARDPTILSRAAEEGRASPTFAPCGTVFRDDAVRFCRHNPRYAKECARLKDDLTYVATLAAEAKPVWGPNPPRYEPDLSLRAGERVLFLWDCLPGEFNCKVTPPGVYRQDWVPQDQLPPHHFCGIGPEKKDVVNYRFWKPYAKRIRNVRTCRYYANGRHLYEPDLRRAAPDDFEKNTFASDAAGGGPALHVRRRNAAAALICKLHTPHVYTSLAVRADFRRARRGDVSRLSLSVDGCKTWRRVWSGAGAGRTAALVTLRDKVVGMRDLWLKVECRTRGEVTAAGLDSLKFDAIFQHNMHARPYLAPGPNRVTVRVAEPRALKAVPLDVTYKWKEGRAQQTHTRRVTRSPSAYTVHVAGKDMPRMVSLELAAK